MTNSNKNITILGIESSCDETAAAIVQNGNNVISNVVATQFELHEEYGGVVPEIASRAHIQRILPVIQKAVDTATKKTNLNVNDLDAIAVGHRPGLIGSLLVGVAAAKTLAWAWNKPLIGVDHIIAHLHACYLNNNLKPEFPALGLVVSGGHTSLFLMNSYTNIQLIGKTIDDAIGEAYDKAAMMLGLGYPGGHIIDKNSALGNENAYKFPVAKLDNQSLNFSYSGLKTSLLYTIRGKPVGHGAQTKFPHDNTHLNQQQINDLCASFQKAAVAAVILKLKRAYKQMQNEQSINLHSLIIGGGVSANSLLRSQTQIFADKYNLKLFLPPIQYCTDNAAMIAASACHNYIAGKFSDLTLTPSPAGTF